MLLILLFLSAAKSHGRQHRLERELAGYWNVSFKSENDPWVERFWLRQRVLYWSLASFVSLFIFLRLKKKKANLNWKKWIVFAVPSVILSMIAAFTVTGLLSMMRLFWNLAQNEPPPGSEWVTNAVFGSIAWWLTTAVLSSLLLITRRRLLPG